MANIFHLGIVALTWRLEGFTWACSLCLACPSFPCTHCLLNYYYCVCGRGSSDNGDGRVEGHISQSYQNCGPLRCEQITMYPQVPRPSTLHSGNEGNVFSPIYTTLDLLDTKGAVPVSSHFMDSFTENNSLGFWLKKCYSVSTLTDLWPGKGGSGVVGVLEEWGQSKGWWWDITEVLLQRFKFSCKSILVGVKSSSQGMFIELLPWAKYCAGG